MKALIGALVAVVASGLGIYAIKTNSVDSKRNPKTGYKDPYTGEVDDDATKKEAQARLKQRRNEFNLWKKNHTRVLKALIQTAKADKIDVYEGGVVGILLPGFKGTARQRSKWAIKIIQDRPSIPTNVREMSAFKNKYHYKGDIRTVGSDIRSFLASPEVAAYTSSMNTYRANFSTEFSSDEEDNDDK